MEHASTSPPPKLLDQVADKLRFPLFHPHRRSLSAIGSVALSSFITSDIRATMGAAEIEAFLTDLAVNGRVAASTQNQAFSALLFLYRNVLEIELPNLNVLRAKRPERLPVVLSVDEVRADASPN